MAKNLSLPALRRICGYTQAGLAKRIGVSHRTIVAIEGGTRPLTDSNARRIMSATGVLPQSLLREDLPRALDGKPYSREHWDVWRTASTHCFPDGSPMSDHVGDAIHQQFKSLLKAAGDSGRILLLAEEFRIMLSRLLDDEIIRGRYLAERPNDSAESIGSLIEDSLAFAIWELGDASRSEDPFGDPLGSGYEVDD